MIKDQIIHILKAHPKELKHFHVKAIYLFGSVARDEESPQSDVDILVAFEGQPTFDRYMELKFFLENLFERKVDLVTEAGLRPELRKSVNEDLIRAGKAKCYNTVLFLQIVGAFIQRNNTCFIVHQVPHNAEVRSYYDFCHLFTQRRNIYILQNADIIHLQTVKNNLRAVWNAYRDYTIVVIISGLDVAI